MSTQSQRSACFQALIDLFRSSPEPSLEEAKKYAKSCLDSETKYEKISFGDIIRQNYKQQEDDLVMLVTAFDLLLRYATNLLKPKLPNMWRTIPITSGTFKARVDCMKGARDILKLIGYTIQTETAVRYPDEQHEPDRNKLVEVAAEILLAKVETEELINNPRRKERYLKPWQTDIAWTTPPSSVDRSSSSPSTVTLQPSPSGDTQPSVNNILLSNAGTMSTGSTSPSPSHSVPPSLRAPVPQPRKKGVNQTPVNQTPVNQTPVNQTPVNQTPVLDEHKKKLDEIRNRHQELRREPQHSRTVPNLCDSTAVNKVESVAFQAPPTQGDTLKVTPPEKIHRATLEDANKVVQNYRTQILNILPHEPVTFKGLSGVVEGSGEIEPSMVPVPGRVVEDRRQQDEGRGDPESNGAMSPNAVQCNASTYEALKMAAKAKSKHAKHGSDIPNPEPVAPCHMTSEIETARNQIKNAGMELLRSITELSQQGYSPEEAHFMAKSGRDLDTSKTEWNKRIIATQQWVDLENPSVGTPSGQDAVRFLLKNMGNIDKAKNDCYQERVEKITSVMNKMKPFMEVPWDAAKAALCDCDMDVEKAVWALQRDGLGPIYEFINSEQEWAKVKQSDMGEIKELLRRGGWTDHKSPLRLLVGECKFEDTERANIVMKLMDHLEVDGKGCELQFYIDAVKEHRTLERAMNFLYVECPICTEHYTTHEMVLMPGCPHSVCKECFDGHFTNVMKTQTVKHFNCPVCSLPDMSNRDADQDMYQELLVTMVKQLCTSEVAEICSQKLNDHKLSTDPNFCWCANDKCHAGFINEVGRDKIACPTCKKEMCFKCKKPWEKEHEGLTCDQFAQWKHDNDPQLQQQGLAAHLEANGIECPACHFRYDLARGGCMHFKCTQCPNEFCSGCGQAFKQQCKKFASCAKRGLHAHHPRDCLFYLRDFTVQELQGFLEKKNVPFDKEPPKAQLEAAALNNDNQKEEKQSLKCRVLLQKETADGLKDEPCGTEAAMGCAGLCEVHYKEYLVGKLNNAHLDPISLYSVNQLQAMLSRDDKQVPLKEDEEDEIEYSKRLVKYIEEELPLERK